MHRRLEKLGLSAAAMKRIASFRPKTATTNEEFLSTFYLWREQMGDEGFIDSLVEAMSPEDRQKTLDTLVSAQGKAAGVKPKRATQDNAVWDMVDRCRAALGDEQLVQELILAMDTEEARANLEHIIQMHEITAYE